MKFNTKGYLDAGLHPMTVDDVEKIFVTGFPSSNTRQGIIDGYKKHADDLAKIINECVQFIDGSFVTNKNDPGDIDMVCLIDGDTVDALAPAEQTKLAALLSGPATKATHKCDAYLVVTYPETHPAYPAARQQRKYWMGEFGFDRQDHPKGIVTIDVKAQPAVAATPPAAGATS